MSKVPGMARILSLLPEPSNHEVEIDGESAPLTVTFFPSNSIRAKGPTWSSCAYSRSILFDLDKKPLGGSAGGEDDPRPNPLTATACIPYMAWGLAPVSTKETPIKTGNPPCKYA